jgi:rifampicin phosphotransferase
MRFPSLLDRPAATVAGQKFAALAAAAGAHRVPDAIVIPVAEFRAALEPRLADRIAALMAETRATVGAFFVEHAHRIEAVAAGIRLPDAVREPLRRRLTGVFGDLDRVRLAVRSSGLAEDGTTGSHAGVYRSFLDLRGADTVLDAVDRCWQAYYGMAAVAARVRAGDFTPEPALAVMVQRYVAADLAGVAFTGLSGDPDGIVVEYVEGPADGLVSGESVAHRVYADTLASVPGTHRATLGEVVALSRELRTRRGHDVDVEWAADTTGVSLLQVRPVTARLPGPEHGGDFWIRRLYVEDPPDGWPLGEVARVHAAFSAKRGPANRLAREHGVAVTTGWVVGFTGRSLRDPANRGRLAAALAAGHGPDCLVDLGDSLRQIVLSKAEAIDRVGDIVAADGRSGAPRAVVIRDYLRGRLGAVTRLTDDGLLVEYSPEGLLALNRGTASGAALRVTPTGEAHGTAESAPLLPHLAQLAAFTRVMQSRYGPVSVEWVLDGDRMVFLDYSLLGAAHAQVTHAGDVISAGTARGPVLNVPDGEFLRRLSIGPAVSIGGPADFGDHDCLTELLARVRDSPEPPIIRASRPYAALSVLIGSVAGFVFDQGSVLSHLAILLREAKVPAVCAGDLGAVPDGALAAIGSGALSVAPDGASR